MDAQTLASAEYFDKIRQALTGRQIVKVLLPLPNTPFVDLVLVLDNGDRVMIGATSSDPHVYGNPALSWGLNVPGDDEIGLV